ncbi:MAG: DksA/TraR family C4-type zinc finger protein [Gammaproteobacteria bacterium]|nr:DksA/TraR family C4-type zinc finger protein [Gammaproteobacteria bacterium]
MAGGWAKDGAVQEQIDASVEDAVRRARAQLAGAESSADCAQCGATIPEARRKALPSARHCIGCQELKDAEQRDIALYNRRGSKDSQLR